MKEASQTIYLWRKRSGQIGAWATGTHQVRAHSSLGNGTPIEFKQKQYQRRPRCAVFRNAVLRRMPAGRCFTTSR